MPTALPQEITEAPATRESFVIQAGQQLLLQPSFLNPRPYGWRALANSFSMAVKDSRDFCGAVLAGSASASDDSRRREESLEER
jgi:hypothetical protein